MSTKRAKLKNKDGLTIKQMKRCMTLFRMLDVVQGYLDIGSINIGRASVDIHLKSRISMETADRHDIPPNSVAYTCELDLLGIPYEDSDV